MPVIVSFKVKSSQKSGGVMGWSMMEEDGGYVDQKLFICLKGYYDLTELSWLGLSGLQLFDRKKGENQAN